MEVDVSEQEDLLQLREFGLSLSAAGTWQQDDVLGHTSAEWQVGCIFDGRHSIFLLTRYSIEVLQAKQDLVTGLKDLTIHCVDVWLTLNSTIANKGIAVASEVLCLENLLHTIDHALEVIQHHPVALTLMDDEHNVGSVGDIIT